MYNVEIYNTNAYYWNYFFKSEDGLIALNAENITVKNYNSIVYGGVLAHSLGFGALTLKNITVDGLKAIDNGLVICTWGNCDITMQDIWITNSKTTGLLIFMQNGIIRSNIKNVHIQKVAGGLKGNIITCKRIFAGSNLYLENFYIEDVTSQDGGLLYAELADLSSHNAKNITLKNFNVAGGAMYYVASQSKININLDNIKAINCKSSGDGGLIRVSDSTANLVLQNSQLSSISGATGGIIYLSSVNKLSGTTLLSLSNI